MLTRLSIERFRGIPSLTVEDLGKVNIFIGENGAGKTTVLDAVCLVSQPNRPDTVDLPALRRELPPLKLSNVSAATSLFFDGDLNHGPSFRFSDDTDEELQLEIRALKEAVTIRPLNESTDSVWRLPEAVPFSSLEFVVESKSGDRYRSTLAFQSPFSIQQYWDNRRTWPGCFYLDARRSISIKDTATFLTEINKEKRSGKLLELLGAIEPRVKQVQPGTEENDPVVLVDIGLSKMLPINVLGDGFCRFVLMASGLLSSQLERVAIDEIDSGLHSSVMGRFWSYVRELVALEKKQIFCTTHSEEMLSRTIEAFADSPELLRIFRIDRLKDGRIEATKYDYEKYRMADAASLDIR